jgi:hypothetical protein
MFGIHYLKSGPTHYVLHYQNGRLRHQGTGLAFFYYKPSTTIVVVPVGSADVPFIFNEATADFQPITVQGQLTYRIKDAELVASLLDYTVDGAIDNYTTEDPDKLPLRLVNLVQVATRAEVQQRPLRTAIQASDEIVTGVLSQISSDPALAALGVEIITFSIQAIKPTPETSRALEAEARENLLRLADGAIYDRRNAAVEQERRIKENELNTELAVEEKKRQIRETQVEADLAVERKQQEIRETQLAGQIKLENERKQFVEARVENARAEADAQAYAVAASLQPLQELDDDMLQLLMMQSAEPRLLVTQALKELAQNASKIGQLNISPDLLESLMRQK